nr:DUF2974 domain-containing protein [uncultured Acetatifactor sp.]
MGGSRAGRDMGMPERRIRDRNEDVLRERCKMGTLLNYLEKYGKYTFREMPMTDVDSLALCQLAYLKFDGMVPGAEDGMPGVPGAGGGLHAGAGASEMGASGASGAEAFEVKVSGAEVSKVRTSGVEACKAETSGAETSGAEASGAEASGAETSGAEASRAEASKVETSGVEASKAGASEGMGAETETAAEAEAEVSKGFPEEPSERPGVTLESLKEHPDFEKLFADVRYEKPNRALYERMVQGKRFRNLELNYYVNVIEERWETQFSAVTFTLGDGSRYVAYRGTDETIVGWKEDFNMAFLTPVPGQAISVEYLNRVAGRFGGPLYVGGHSKGGNLAVYSAMNCNPDIQDRIRKIYSMDGPGFRPEVLRECDYGKIADRVVKILPNSSLVGMIFESGMYFQVVKSKTFGLLQHDPYTWLVTGNHLVRADRLYERRQQMDNNLNQWILSLNEQQLRTFVDTLYQVITASQADNLIDFTAEWKKSMNGVIAALKEVDEETVEALKEIVRSLFEIARENRKKQVAAKAEAALEALGAKGKDGRPKADS